MELSKSSVPGVAPIKSEYLVKDHVRELDLKFVGKTDQKQMNKDEEEDGSDGPPKKKLKGQNKHRPRNQRTPKADKLCFKIGVEGICPFGDTCSYSHDVTTYLANKPPDISSCCYLYKTFGKCPYSYSCRFGADHIIDGKNVTMEEKWSYYKDQKLNFNALSKDLQRILRRREYDFKKSNEVFKNFDISVKSNKCNRLSSDTNSRDISNSKNASIEKPNEVTMEKEKQNVTSDNTPSVHCKTNKITENDLSTQTEEKSKYVSDVEESSNFMSDPPNNLKSEVDFNSSSIGEMEKEIPVQDPSISDTSSSSKNLDDTIFELEAKKFDFKDKLYLAPLTTVGNLPFRRICKELGADITCSEMSMALSLLQGQQSEWALIKRHHTEDIFGIQLCGAHPDVMTRCCQVLSENASFDFIDLNLGCPLDAVYRKGAGSGLMNRMKKLEGIIYGVSSVINVPLTLKMRTGIYGNENIAHVAIDKIKQWKGSVNLITLHGRSREQRYTKSADWNYIDMCNKISDPIPLFGNGDILSYEDYNTRRTQTGVSGIMIARGALIKPWIFKEIKDQAHWDISASERFDILKKYSNYGLEHWGSDTEGVEKTRRFMLEWLSFLYRYIPVGVLERVPQRINERPPPYMGRNDLETLMASPSCSDWVKISEMLLGPVPENFIFLPKHKANAYK